jgi:ubiquinone/menaquinone biosynthesis C-methylase UbiE
MLIFLLRRKLTRLVLFGILLSIPNFSKVGGDIMDGQLDEQMNNDIAGATLVGNMWNYALTVLYPSMTLKELGLYQPNHIGVRPPLPSGPGSGPHFSRLYPQPVLLEKRPERYDLVEEFDRISREYERFTLPFSGPIFEETLKVIRKYLTPSSRILDTSCGAGTEIMALAALVPEGEAVAADLAAEMVQTTFENSRRAGIANMAFIQADVARLPSEFSGMFDLTFCSLAFHHYPEPEESVQEIYRVLRPGGYAFIADPGPDWYKRISEWLAKWADPGWIGFHNGDEFKARFDRVGFSHYYWEELLPGIGLVIAMK